MEFPTNMFVASARFTSLLRKTQILRLSGRAIRLWGFRARASWTSSSLFFLLFIYIFYRAIVRHRPGSYRSRPTTRDWRVAIVSPLQTSGRVTERFKWSADAETSLIAIDYPLYEFQLKYSSEIFIFSGDGIASRPSRGNGYIVYVAFAADLGPYYGAFVHKIVDPHAGSEVPEMGRCSSRLFYDLPTKHTLDAVTLRSVMPFSQSCCGTILICRPSSHAMSW